MCFFSILFGTAALCLMDDSDGAFRRSSSHMGNGWLNFRTNVGISLANLVTHQAPFSVLFCFVLAVMCVFAFWKDVRTSCVKIMTTYSNVGAWWVKSKKNSKRCLYFIVAYCHFLNYPIPMHWLTRIKRKVINGYYLKAYFEGYTVISWTILVLSLCIIRITIWMYAMNIFF